MQPYEKALFETKFNEVNHTIELYLDNSIGDSDDEKYKYPINPNAVINLTVEDTLADWITKGHLTFLYDPEAGIGELNGYLGQNKDATTGINIPDAKPFYVFRNDGKDRLRLRITPNLGDTNTQQYTNGLIISDPKHWTLSNVFSIYDIEDIGNMPGTQNAASTSMKCLKIYFWDEWYQRMSTNYIEYSTAKSNLNQKLKTGTAMKEIIEAGLKNSAGTMLDTTDGVPVDNDLWEEGSSEIFFTTPTQTTAYESLMYVYDKHISENFLSIPASPGLSTISKDKAYDLSILIKERGPEPNSVGQLTLRPLSNFFQKAGKSQEKPGDYQVEHFFVQGYGNSKETIKPYRAPFSKDSSDTVDFKSLKYSVISNYKFVDIAALMNSDKFCTKPVYSFDFKNRVYNVEFGANSVETARRFISEKYIKEMFIGGGDPEKLFLITLDDDKKQNNNINIKPTFSLYGDEEDFNIRQSGGLKRLLYCGVFQNACINFKTLGLTSREPGRFIGIDKTEGVDEGDFPDKFYGQWFVINVRHVFETELYYNEITAVKIHRFDEQSFKFPGTF